VRLVGRREHPERRERCNSCCGKSNLPPHGRMRDKEKMRGEGGEKTNTRVRSQGGGRKEGENRCQRHLLSYRKSDHGDQRLGNQEVRGSFGARSTSEGGSRWGWSTGPSKQNPPKFLSRKRRKAGGEEKKGGRKKTRKRTMINNGVKKESDRPSLLFAQST